MSDSTQQHSTDELARAWLVCMGVLAVWLFAWWLHLRPGVFSFDSGFYVHEVLSGNFNNRKPFLFARFLQLTSWGGRAVHVSVLVQMALVVIGLSRVFAIAWVRRAPRWLIAAAACVVLNPYVANMALYLQNDVLFCVAITVILAETLYMARSGVVNSASSYCVLAVYAPMAFGFRENGLLFLPPWIVLTWFVLHRTTWIRSTTSAMLATLVVYTSIIGVDREDRHELLYPAVVHETVRLAQPGYRYGLGERLSPATVSAVGRDKLELAVPLYWPLYWDSIAFFPEGPVLLELEKPRRDALVDQFLKNDLLPNLPSIFGHRVEMFTAALLARAEPVDPYGAPSNLPPDLVAWKQHVASFKEGRGIMGWINETSYASRGFTWNAGVGLLALAVLTGLALWSRSGAGLAAALLLWIQAGAILLVAPSAEYRYLFMIYLAPLVLMVFAARAKPAVDTQARPSQFQK